MSPKELHFMPQVGIIKGLWPTHKYELKHVSRFFHPNFLNINFLSVSDVPTLPKCFSAIPLDMIGVL
jgi:hypothetical protein